MYPSRTPGFKAILPGFATRSFPRTILISVALLLQLAHPAGVMSGAAETAAVSPTASPLAAFTGSIARSKSRPVYSAGLVTVACAMVLLPLIYLGLIALTAWLVLLHLTYDTWMFRDSNITIIRLLVYLGPAAAGVILVFFMVKPFFAAKPKPAAPITLVPAKEPLLFAFVERICSLVGAPVPCRIDVDCQVNASASLRRGIWSRDLVLTVGLPLASGLDMREFAGVLAHEFGHFAQGAGLRLTYIIRHINIWFARVVYERDTWDLHLERAASHSDWRLAVVLQMARGCVWLTRRILWALMQAGHAISCFMLRQMEFDADSYEAKLAGSDAFESTSARMRVLGAATRSAYDDVRQSWASSRLPENLPLLIQHKAGLLPETVVQDLSAASAAVKTRWSDTHPCDADRMRAARRLNEPGVFRLTQPATGLFADFNALSKAVTRHEYEKRLQLRFTGQNLVPAEEFLRESAASAHADALVRKYYGAVNASLKPLFLAPDIPPPAREQHNLLEQWEQARETAAAARPAAEKASTECLEQQRRHTNMLAAHWLAKAGFKVPPKDFGLPDTATSVHEQEIAARFALEETAAAIAARLASIDPFISALRQRAVLALQFADGSQTPPAPESLGSLELRRLFTAVAAEMPRANELAPRFQALQLLARNRPNHSNPRQVDQALSQLAAELRPLLEGIQTRLQGFVYPFPNPRGRLTVAEYARSEHPGQNPLQSLYLDTGAHVERLFALHYRLLGLLLAQVELGETNLDAAASEKP
jgi:Zn-dependent protease with chaperone function